MVEKGERGPLWIVSAEQTSGKGRLGRSWISRPGNFYGTLLWPTTAPTSALPQASFAAALAVHATASEFSGASHISLKWPNDCLLDGSKFCGILCEGIVEGLIALGIGINIAHLPEGLPYKAARLEKSDVELVFEKLRLNISKYLEIWDAGAGFNLIRADWMARCPHIGLTISVDGQTGIFSGLGPDGALLLQLASGQVKAIYAGDVGVEYQSNP